MPTNIEASQSFSNLLLIYLMIGVCTQLPGVIFGYFLNINYFRKFKKANLFTRLFAGIFWLVFTIIAWPIPFIRVGINKIAFMLMSIGFISSLIILEVTTTLLSDSIIFLIATSISLIIARPKKRIDNEIGNIIKQEESLDFSKIKEYDVFISYKSENVDVVRPFAEQLIAAGLNVWFAEYIIVLYGREYFDKAIDNGLKKAKIGICFTNDLYEKSEWCQYEKEQLLRSKSQQNIIEIIIPTESISLNFRSLPIECLSTVYKGDMNEILEFVQNIILVPISKILYEDSFSRERKIFKCLDQNYSLDFTGWKVNESEFFKFEEGDVAGPRFRRENENFAMWGNLIIGIGNKDPKRSHVDNLRVSKGSVVNDRECYDYAIDFAKEFFAKYWQQKDLGVHLSFLLGHSHFAITTRFKPFLISRRYSIILHSPKLNQILEFAFVFFFRGTFLKFCRYAYLMDSVVGSLNFE